MDICSDFGGHWNNSNSVHEGQWRKKGHLKNPHWGTYLLILERGDGSREGEMEEERKREIERERQRDINVRNKHCLPPF